LEKLNLIKPVVVKALAGKKIVRSNGGNNFSMSNLTYLIGAFVCYKLAKSKSAGGAPMAVVMWAIAALVSNMSRLKNA